MRKIFHLVFLGFWNLTKTFFPSFLFFYCCLFGVFLLKVSQTVFLSNDRWLLAILIWLMITILYVFVFVAYIAFYAVYRSLVK